MLDTSVRIIDVELLDFKNIRHGELSFENSRRPYAASVVGVYGQNGSGKTALISALGVLKFVLAGRELPSQFTDFIAQESTGSRFKFHFLVQADSCDVTTRAAHVFYEFTLARKSTVGQAIALEDAIVDIPVITDECVSILYQYGDFKTKKQEWLNTADEIKPFTPATKYKLLVGTKTSVKNSLLVAKGLAQGRRASFALCPELREAIESNIAPKQLSDVALNGLGNLLTNQKDIPATEYSVVAFLRILERLIRYGQTELFVIDAAQTGIISMNALPLQMKKEPMGSVPGVAGTLLLSLNQANKIPANAFQTVQSIFKSLNIVLKELVPGLQISVNQIGKEIDDKGRELVQVELMSLKNTKPLPLRYESEGIKKIISVLHLLICVFNQRSITVAIDELDAGIFEYLLGELLKIISENGKGQLVFTSHNLRVLETLDKGFIAFTTTDPDAAYTRLTNVKQTNNLRDFYYRSLMLGPDSERLYRPTDNSKIVLAMKRAGRVDV